MSPKAKRRVRTDYRAMAAQKELENQALRVALATVMRLLGQHFGNGLLPARPPDEARGTPVGEAYRVAEDAARRPVA
jgi:hypothetical protein